MVLDKNTDERYGVVADVHQKFKSAHNSAMILPQADVPIEEDFIDYEDEHSHANHRYEEEEIASELALLVAKLVAKELL